MKFGLFGFGFDKGDQTWFNEFLAHLKSRGHSLYLYKGLLCNLNSYHTKSDYPILDSVDDLIRGELDMLISLGGDGTMLRAVSYSYAANVPIAGINLGRLGFLASVEKKNVVKALSFIEKGDYIVQNRSLIKLHSTNKNLFYSSPVALNDFTVAKRDTSSMITVNTFINGDFFNTYWADGLIVSTPTGSTGYSLSCGGPIVSPGSGNLIITPIAPHNLNVRPVVIPDSSVIELRPEGRTNSFLCSLDSRYQAVSSSASLVVKKSKQYARIVVLGDYSFSEVLRQKLGWGVDKRTNMP
ncbi:MAG: NAD kinase [Saprospirales bacterium]|nr:MAG: NAD kinase [Saprospirales bacterium]